MKRIGKTVTLVILVLSIFTGCTGCGQIVTEPMPSEETNAETSYTEETKPTEMISTEPSETEPPVTEPPVTEPAETEPVITEPPVAELPHVHSYTAAVKEATCTEAGYTTYTCTCGDSYIDSYVAPVEDVFPFTDAELAAAVIKHINQIRKDEGSPELIPQVGMGNVAQYRSVQLLTNYAHDIKDKREALAYYQYGRYIDMTEYGFDESYNYYEADTQEAIGHFAAIKEPVDETAKMIALAFRNSEAHWSYLGDPENQYIAVGCSKDKYDWYICIMVSEVTYG